MRISVAFLAIFSLFTAVFGADLSAEFSTKIGEAKIAVFSLNSGQMDNKLLIPASKKDEGVIAQKRTPNAHNVMLVKARGANILIDTGYEKTFDALESALKSEGLKPADITHIVLSHAHFDHIGGMLKNGKKTFANALLLVDEKEFNHWQQNGDENTKKAFASYKKEFFNHEKPLFDASTFGINIRAIKAYGHTPGHNFIAFYSTDAKLDSKGADLSAYYKKVAASKPDLVFVADLFHAYEAQIKSPDIALVFDTDKKDAIAARKAFLGAFKGVPFIGAHMPTSTPLVLK